MYQPCTSASQALDFVGHNQSRGYCLVISNGYQSFKPFAFTLDEYRKIIIAFVLSSLYKLAGLLAIEILSQDGIFANEIVSYKDVSCDA